MDLSQLEPAIEELLTKTGIYIQHEFEHFSYDRVSYKAAHDPFTDVDVTADEMLRTACSLLIPDAGFINEELGQTDIDHDYRWIIDPIDGTVNFMHGIPHFCISLALQYKQETVLGYVYQPTNQDLYKAVKGKGAWLNGQRLSVSPRAELEHAIIATGFPYSHPDWLADFMKMVVYVAGYSQGIRRMGSAALDLAYVAAGRLEGFFEYQLKPWDMAAGALLVQEAGGSCTGFESQSDFVFSGQVIASNGHLHQELMNLIHQGMPSKQG